MKITFFIIKIVVALVCRELLSESELQIIDVIENIYSVYLLIKDLKTSRQDAICGASPQSQESQALMGAAPEMSNPD